MYSKSIVCSGIEINPFNTPKENYDELINDLEKIESFDEIAKKEECFIDNYYRRFKIEELRLDRIEKITKLNKLYDN